MISLPVLVPGGVRAQNPAELFTKAPPEVDEALRGRVSKFYQAHVDGKPRRAEELVAEESKDYFYDMKKPKYLSFEITKIDYSDNFTKAKVLVLVGTYLPVMGFADKPVKAPLLSTWKVVDGQWYWYIDPDVINTTPFGKMGTPPGYDPAKSAAGALPDISKGPDLQALSKKVHADKLIARLNPREASSDQVTITNDLPGTVTLQLDTLKVPGFDARLDRTQLKGGEKAVLSLHFQPGKRAPRSMLANVTVQPINTLLRIQVLFQ
ncbi:MAG TPA: hypothetical protein VJN43_21835 [Bryobacteraceae bacterium]|nr:hypothetical protein [Bryobacteraceae bacterium]